MEKKQDLSFQTNVLENTPVHRHNMQEPMTQANESIFLNIYINRWRHNSKLKEHTCS